MVEGLSPFPNLCVLPAGPEPPNPQELLGRHGFGALLDQLAREFDVILVDTPALDQCSDAKLVASKARGAVVVARQGSTRVSMVKNICAQLNGMGVEIAGSVLNTY